MTPSRRELQPGAGFWVAVMAAAAAPLRRSSSE